MRTDNLDYFRRRAAEERQAAVTCADPAVAAAHLHMAAEYQRRLDELCDQPGLRQVR